MVESNKRWSENQESDFMRLPDILQWKTNRCPKDSPKESFGPLEKRFIDDTQLLAHDFGEAIPLGKSWALSEIVFLREID